MLVALRAGKGTPARFVSKRPSAVCSLPARPRRRSFHLKTSPTRVRRGSNSSNGGPRRSSFAARRPSFPSGVRPRRPSSVVPFATHIPATRPPVFPEEPLHLGLDQCSGYFAGRIGETLEGGRYTIRRKLGWGRYSNVWLCTEGGGSPVAIKVCTAFATQRYLQGHSREPAALERLRDGDGTPNALPHLIRHFIHEDRQGQHLCLVLAPDAQTILDYTRTFGGRPPNPVVKRIAHSLLVALKRLGEAGIMHTDIKLDNIFFRAETSALMQAIEDSSAQDKAYRPPELTFGGVTYSTPRSSPISMSPLPIQGHDDDPKVSGVWRIILGDFSHAELVDRPATTKNFQPEALRAPEIILNAPPGPAMDIWNLACILFELFTGRRLFDPHEAAGKWSQHDDLLTQMQARTGNRFLRKKFPGARLWDFYFQSGGKLRRPSDLAVGAEEGGGGLPSIRDGLAQRRPDVDAAQLDLFADFLKGCLVFNPADRPSAKALLEHPWLKGIE